MNFEIDMTKVVKIVVQKNDDSFIEYSIDNGVIVDASIIKREKTIEEKVEELKNNPDVQKISKLIEFDNARVLTKMAENGNNTVFDAIKEDIVNKEIDLSKTIKEETAKVNKDVLTEKAKESVEIMKMKDKMDETAKVFRGVIAEKLSEDKPKDVKQGEIDNDIDKALAISDRDKRINYLKDVISKINTKKEEDNE